MLFSISVLTSTLHVRSDLIRFTLKNKEPRARPPSTHPSCPTLTLSGALSAGCEILCLSFWFWRRKPPIPELSPPPSSLKPPCLQWSPVAGGVPSDGLFVSCVGPRRDVNAKLAIPGQIECQEKGHGKVHRYKPHPSFANHDWRHFMPFKSGVAMGGYPSNVVVQRAVYPPD